jgi:pyoverdine/dityrosine biosynthesis protein Dit1
VEAPTQGKQPRSRRSRLRVLEAALASFAKRGYEATSYKEIAALAEVSVGLACRYFPSKESFVLALYDRLANELEHWAGELPEGTVAVRFRAAMGEKLRLIEPHRQTLTALAARAFDPTSRTSVLGSGTEVVRSKVAGVMWLVVCGASDAPASAEAGRLARLLYGLHLLLVLLSFQVEDPKVVSEATDLVCAGLALRNLVPDLGAGALLARVDALFSHAFATSRSLAPSDAARRVLDRIFRRRRLLQLSGDPTSGSYAPVEVSEASRSLHLGRIQSFIEAKEPIQLVLPAFPAKAPNLRKVLGKLPDAAEWLALESLDQLLDDITEAHAPGAELVICSDGHVFADAVGVPDPDVRAYRAELERMLLELGSRRIRVFGLEDAMGKGTPDRMRAWLMASYAQTEEEVHARAKASKAHAAQLDGIHRFLFEDEVVRHPSSTRSQARKAARAQAYEVVRRSDAWGRLVAAAFPRAVRLSIHPQPDVSSKIGVWLLGSEDQWLTPWHAVALMGGERARLIHRSDAEALGAVVVEEEGRASYMEVGA